MGPPLHESEYKTVPVGCGRRDVFRPNPLCPGKVGEGGFAIAPFFRLSVFYCSTTLYSSEPFPYLCGNKSFYIIHFT